jgi:hypothetical protein
MNSDPLATYSTSFDGSVVKGNGRLVLSFYNSQSHDKVIAQPHLTQYSNKFLGFGQRARMKKVP